MSLSNNKESKFNFLPDEAIGELKDDKFKHSGIATTLKNIILNCPLPFTIGVFGRWGTGKSTIANLLRKKLKTSEEIITVIDFDVWKYENDSLRRQFLINIDEKLDLKLNYRKKLNQSLSIPFELSFWRKFKIQIKDFLFKGGIVIVVLFIIFAIIKFTTLSEILDEKGLLNDKIVEAFYDVSLLGLMISFVLNSFTTVMGVVQEQRLDSAEGFEYHFNEKILPKIGKNRLLIIIDNLDRCTHRKAVELLSTIKTYLEPKNKKCIFLIQCDEEAIKEHLKSIYIKDRDNAIFDADEFLRKFFSTSIKIPPFIDADLEEYTKELLQSTNVEEFNNSDLISVITQAFRENPRQIKQFINTLLSHYLLALERESGGDQAIRTSEIITKNTAFLAKYLIIRQKWPDFYERIINDPEVLESYSYHDDDSKELVDFIGGTSIVKTDNLRVFIYFKESRHKLRLPGDAGDSLEIAFEDKRDDEVIKMIKEIRNKGVKDEVIADFIYDLLEKNEKVKARQNLVNIISLTALSTKELKLNLPRKVYEKIVDIITKILRGQLNTFNIDFVFGAIKKSRPDFVEPIILEYIHILGQAKDAKAVENIPNYHKYALELASNININKDLFSSKKSELAVVLSNAHFDNINLLKVFEKNKAAIKDFINFELLVKLIGSIQEADFINEDSKKENLFNKKINFVLACKTVINTQVSASLLEKFNALLTVVNQTPEAPEKQVVVKEILDKIEFIVGKYIIRIQDQEKSDILADTLKQSVEIFSPHIQKALFIPAFFYVEDIVSEGKKISIEEIIQTFFREADLPTIKALFEGKSLKLQQKIFKIAKIIFEDKAILDKDFLDFVWEFENEKDKSVLLAKVINSPNYVLVFDKLKEINYKISNSKNIVDALLEKATSLPLDTTRDPIYNAINKMECSKDKELRDKYIGQLQNLIIGQDAISQEVGYNAYIEANDFLPETGKLNLIVAIIEWLNKLEVVNLTHKFSLMTAFSNWDEISDTHKDNLITIIFDRLIIKTTLIDELNMGFDIVYSVKPTYSKYKPHFDIVLSRVEKEGSAEIKEVLKTGLQKLKLPKAYIDRIKKL